MIFVLMFGPMLVAVVAVAMVRLFVKPKPLVGTTSRIDPIQTSNRHARVYTGRKAKFTMTMTDGREIEITPFERAYCDGPIVQASQDTREQVAAMTAKWPVTKDKL